jgi:hypothetical protein
MRILAGQLEMDDMFMSPNDFYPKVRFLESYGSTSTIMMIGLPRGIKLQTRVAGTCWRNTKNIGFKPSPNNERMLLYKMVEECIGAFMTHAAFVTSAIDFSM